MLTITSICKLTILVSKQFFCLATLSNYWVPIFDRSNHRRVCDEESRWTWLTGDQLISTQSIPNQPSAHPRVANAREPIPHVSWEFGCTIGAMVSTFIVTGIFAIVMMESLLLLMWRRLCCHQASVIALVAFCQAGIVALVVMALLPSMHRRLCCCCNGNICCRHNGAVTAVNAQASPPLLS